MRTCETPELLERFLHDQLEGREREIVAAHLESCTACQQVLERFTNGSEMAGDSQSDPEEEDEVARLLERVKAKGPRPLDLDKPDAVALDAQSSDSHVAGSASIPEEVKPSALPLQLFPTISGFRIIRQIGRGGMGVVFEAEEETLHRKVALKVLPPDALIDSRKVERFEREAKAAARLHHTNIVPVFGFGRQGGNRYYAMQFIEGPGLDVVLDEMRRLKQSGPASRRVSPAKAYASDSDGPDDDDHPATGAPAEEVAQSLANGRFADPAGRVRGETTSDANSDATAILAPPVVPLEGRKTEPSSSGPPGSSGLSSLSTGRPGFFRSVALVGIQVGEALEYANRQGVFHRDIKPSNLLLDGRGHVWVADFGLARSSEDDGLTQSGELVGTLRYMAPERFQGRFDARSDIYSLGLTLYELVALRPVYDESDRHKLIARIQADEPAPLKKLVPETPRDLVTIIQKAMAREPARRYGTAELLAEDLRRFLEGRTILARRASFVERSFRWCRRNPWAAGFFMVLLAGLCTAAGFAVRTSQAEATTRLERDRAREEAENAVAIEEFLSNDVLGKAAAANQAGPSATPKADLKVREALDNAAARIAERFQRRPKIQASIRLTIGESYLGLGLIEKAIEHLGRAFNLRRESLGPEHPDTLVAEAKLATAQMAADRLVEAEGHLIHATEGLLNNRGDLAPEYLKALNNLGEVHFYGNRIDQAEQEFARALDGWTKVPAPDERERLSVVNNLAMTYQVKGRYSDTATVLEEMIPDMRQVFGPEHPDTLIVISNLAELYVHLDKPGEAEPRFREVLEVRTRVLGDENHATLGTMHDLAHVCDQLGNSKEAEDLGKKVLAGRRKVLGPEHSSTLMSMNSLAAHYRKLGRLNEAEKLFRQSYDGLSSKRGDDDPDTLFVAGNLGMVLKDLGRLEEAKILLEQTDARMLHRLSKEHPDRLRVLSNRASVLIATGNPAGAEPLLREVLQGRQKAMGEDHSLTLETFKDLAACLELLGRVDEARSMQTEVATIQSGKVASGSPPRKP